MRPVFGTPTPVHQGEFMLIYESWQSLLSASMDRARSQGYTLPVLRDRTLRASNSSVRGKSSWVGSSHSSRWLGLRRECRDTWICVFFRPSNILGMLLFAYNASTARGLWQACTPIAHRSQAQGELQAVDWSCMTHHAVLFFFSWMLTSTFADQCEDSPSVSHPDEDAWPPEADRVYRKASEWNISPGTGSRWTSQFVSIGNPSGSLLLTSLRRALISWEATCAL